MRFLVLLASLLAVSCRTASDPYAALQTLNAQLLASSSATQTLERWCADHRMAAEPKIVAVRSLGAARPAPAETLQRLGVQSPEEVRYRHVELRCGTHVFSEADNWYVPSRLTPEMNELLETTDTPFGKVVRPLQPYRKTLHATVLWTPDGRGRGAQIPRQVLEHRAVLYTSAHQPFSEVVEIYRGEVLAFGSR